MNKAGFGKVKGFITIKRPDGTVKARVPFEGTRRPLSTPPSSTEQPKDKQVS